MTIEAVIRLIMLLEVLVSSVTKAVGEIKSTLSETDQAKLKARLEELRPQTDKLYIDAVKALEI